ncbi:endoribonuclease L-PSP [Anaerobacterium chartisolvens]|uniref:Endoribonuclease L-PSP n=1 Tax=Anaerobacterium chartisolvens TaxID=1297424 RepID=A0A369B9R0_9FIRM|nr:RidA family protein [Anaerobacterium chartisolvens]RCX18263.1 endoribonuclease L-PSP [Anaerobacterium chartisolvens]
MPDITIVNTDKAPKAIGPYSQAVNVGGRIFTSGQIGIIPETGEMVQGGVEAEAKQALDNLKAVLEAAGSGMKYVTKTTVFIKDMGDFNTVNNIYSQYFEAPYPARSCIEISRMPKDALIEIEAIAFVP